MRRLPYPLIFFLTAVCIALAADAQRVNTMRKHLHRSGVAVEEIATAMDTVTDPAGRLRFCGYEKALRSNNETLFIQNRCDSTLAEISFRIDYLDSQQRKIHTRRVRKSVFIPAHETRRIDIPSWDRQKSYYYVKGERPRKSATPYDVTVSADTLFYLDPGNE